MVANERARELAREIIADHVRYMDPGGHGERIHDRFPDLLPGEQGALALEVDDLISQATVTVVLPSEAAS